MTVYLSKHVAYTLPCVIKKVVLTYKLVLQYVEYKNCCIMLCPSICGVMVNHKYVLHVGWSRYTEIIIKVIMEHMKVIENYKSVNI